MFLVWKPGMPPDADVAVCARWPHCGDDDDGCEDCFHATATLRGVSAC